MHIKITIDENTNTVSIEPLGLRISAQEARKLYFALQMHSDDDTNTVYIEHLGIQLSAQDAYALYIALQMHSERLRYVEAKHCAARVPGCAANFCGNCGKRGQQ
jgi:hypothetical protein